MHIIRRFTALLALLLLAACGGDGLGPRNVTGDWLLRTETTAVTWQRMDLRVSLRPDHTYTWSSYTYAEHGRPQDKLVGYGRTDGRYALRGDSLFLTATRNESWDVLRGGEPEVRVLDDVPAGRYRARALGDKLVLEFVSAPADRDVESRLVLRRED